MKLSSKLILASTLSTLTGSALAHHPLAGAAMETFTHGVLSGVGHPLLGFDHLAFVVLVGIAAAYCGKLFSAPIGYIGGMLLGCLLMMAGVTLPLAEVVIGASLLIMGFIVMSGREMSSNMILLAFGVFGLFHGSAFGESIVGQEAGYGISVAVGYLLGLGAAQYLIAIGTALVLRRAVSVMSAQAIQTRLAGAVVTGVGLFLTLENAETAAFAALGIG
ncbi:MAG: HupE/UreJ family protein [Gammaproteobacteria bacterium]|nr:HupE/UreJ family protein [Gammaproteobacteria bacterium]